MAYHSSFASMGVPQIENQHQNSIGRATNFIHSWSQCLPKLFWLRILSWEWGRVFLWGNMVTACNLQLATTQKILFCSSSFVAIKLLPKQLWHVGMTETTVFLTLISLCSSARLSKCRWEFCFIIWQVHCPDAIVTDPNSPFILSSSFSTVSVFMQRSTELFIFAAICNAACGWMV